MQSPASRTGTKPENPGTRPKVRSNSKPRRATTRLPGAAEPVDPDLRARADRIRKTLAKTYPDAKCALDHETPLDLYVATVLSAQCTDERVNRVTPALFARCRRPEDYLALGQNRLEEQVRSTGFFRAKSRNILEGCRVLLDRFGGQLPRTIEELTKVPGCGRKTANVILGNAFGTPGITVDTHVQRLSKRLGLTQETDPVKIEAALQRLFPEKDWTMISHALIWHGRRICDARKPLCDACTLRPFCPYPERMASVSARGVDQRGPGKQVRSSTATKRPDSTAKKTPPSTAKKAPTSTARNVRPSVATTQRVSAETRARRSTTTIAKPIRGPRANASKSVERSRRRPRHS